MKTTEFIVENSIIAQEADDMHRDHEVQMARSQMYSAAQAAIEIHRLLKDISEMEGIEGWVASKLTLASEYLESVRDYLKYEAVSQEPKMMQFAEDAANYAIESIISEADFTGWKDYVEKNPEKFNEPTRNMYARNTHRFGGDEGLPGARSSGVRTQGDVIQNKTTGYPAGGMATKVERPEGIPKVSKLPITKFSVPGPSGETDPRLGADLDPKMMIKRSMKESATGGASSAGAVATSIGGPAHKPTSGVPKKVGNSYKPKKVAVGKGVYDK